MTTYRINLNEFVAEMRNDNDYVNLGFEKDGTVNIYPKLSERSTLETSYGEEFAYFIDWEEVEGWYDGKEVEEMTDEEIIDGLKWAVDEISNFEEFQVEVA